MDHYIVSARKYRPSTFDTVIGQKPLTAALKHAIATGKLAHAYLFCGSRGVGKTSCARIFAKTINCSNRGPDGEACNECASCRAFNEGSSINIIELDAASHNGVDDMKALIEQVMVPPTQGRYRVFIVDEVHMLTTAAFNAFLKTLEEPPEYVIFILATTEKHKIIPTILSRCQIYDFSRITIRDMVEHLQSVAAQEGISAEPSALGVIARKADGAMRDALSIFDQVAASSMGSITYQSTIDNLNMLDSAYYGRLVEAFLAGNVQAALLIYKEIRDKGFDSQFFINGLALYMRDLMLAMNPATVPLIEADDETRMQMAEVARKCSPPFVYKAMDLCNDADLNYRIASNKQFLIELTLIKLCQLCSPSPSNDGVGEGQLKPIAVAEAPRTAALQAAPAPKAAQAPQSAPAPHPASVPQSAPAPQSPSAPQAAPASQSAPQPAARRGLSIRGFKKSAAKQPDEAPKAEPSALRNKPYDVEIVIKAWDDYAAAHPAERILANTMIMAKPKQIEGDKFFVGVDDAIQVQAINEAKPELLKCLRDAAGNDNIELEAVITQSEASPITWTQREVLQHMIESRPQLQDLITDFGFILA